MTSKSGENDGYLYFRRSLFAILLSPPSSTHKKQKPPTPSSSPAGGDPDAALAAAGGKAAGRFKPHYGVTTLIVHFRRTRIYPGFARIIPDTRPSGSLRSRKIAPGDFFRVALLLIIPAFGGYDKQERRE